MMTTLVKKLKGDLSEFGLIKRWHILQKEKSRGRIPLRVNLEIHEVEHRLIQMAKAKKVM